MVFATDIELLYPSSDGKPMAENKVHYRWITTIEGNLESLFAEDPMVFVAADMNWHPVPRSHPPKEGEYVAPDVMVVFGVPKGDDARRTSYIQHLENNISPQVVFEIHSPSNKAEQRKAKFRFYQQHGVEEYYYYDPKKDELTVWLREGRTLEKVNLGDSWVSPRLQIRFDLSGETMRLYYPNGELFENFAEIRAEKERAEQERDRERMAKERERDRADRFAAKLRELGLDPDKV